MSTFCRTCGDNVDPNQSHCGHPRCPYPDETELTWQKPPPLPGHEETEKPKENPPKFPPSEKEGKNLDRGFSWKELKRK